MNKFPMIIALMISFLFLNACVTDPGDPSGINSGNPTSSDFFGPVVDSKNYVVKINESVDVDLRSLNADESIIYQVYIPPKYGRLLGEAPFLTYFPNGDYLGEDLFYFSALNSRGQMSRATIVVKTESKEKIVYVSQDGNDDEGVVDDEMSPFKTAQKAVEIASALKPTKYQPVVLSFSKGSFGDVEIYEEFGTHVYWRGVGAELSLIGDVVAKGRVSESDENALHAPNLIINADETLSFQNVASNGGNTVPSDSRIPRGGNSGDIIFQGIARNVVLNTGYVNLSGSYKTANIGSITIKKDSIVEGVSAAGYLVSSPSAGGSVFIYGKVLRDVDVSGGDSSSEASGGGGGSVYLEGGIVMGDIYANGGDGGTGGEGGKVDVSGEVYGNIYANSGNSSSEDAWQGNATIIIRPNSVVKDIYANGGNSTLGDGGNGGYVTISDAIAGDVFSIGGNSSSNSEDYRAGNGGGVILEGSSSAGIINVSGGGCTAGSPGNGGSVAYSSLSHFNSEDSLASGGVCSLNLNVGDDGEISEF